MLYFKTIMTLLTSISKYIVHIFGLDEVWNKDRYGDWETYFGWLFFLTGLAWCFISWKYNDWSDPEKWQITIASEILAAAAGTTLAVVLLTEVNKVITKFAIERVRQMESKRLAALNAVREAEYQRLARWAEEKGYEVPPLPSLNGNSDSKSESG